MVSYTKILALILFSFILTACGGDDGDGPVCPPNVPCELLDNNAAPTAGETVTYEVVLSITDAEGNEISSISSINPGRLVATVTGLTEPVIVTFSGTLGDLPITTAVTDDEGNASVVIYAGSQLGAGTITASLVTGEQDTAILVVGATNLEMGSGDPLQVGVASVSSSSLSAGGTTSVSVLIVDEQGLPFKEPADVYFTSACAQLSTPLAQLDSPVLLVGGVATSTYTAKGCAGDDPINVKATVAGLDLIASATINVLEAKEGSISFVSAEPSLISIKTTGGRETSVVKFQVFDTSGNPVTNKPVSFKLNTEMGGTYLSDEHGITDNSGMVQTVVNSGTVATTVRVMATVDDSDPQLITQSSKLIISTGIPDQDSFTLAIKTLNPEAYDIAGVEVPVSVFLADAFNNFAPDGTAVYFTTEGGAIDDSCFTLDGKCSVVWRSHNPAPEDGRSTITAYALGEESFPDSNGNGRFDADEVPLFLSVGVDGKPYDMDEAFNDYNENGIYEPENLEELIDFNVDGQFTEKDGLYNGVLCHESNLDSCADNKSIHIRSSVVIVMSGSTAVGSNIVVTDSENDNGDQELDIVGTDVGQVSLTITDSNDQQMPAGSVVTFTTTVGEVVGQSSFIWPNSNEPGGQSYGVAVKGGTDVETGELVVVVKTPSGHESTPLIIPINITQ
ncbi:Ig-like domain-containing protein [Shewanella sp. 0m-8]